MFRSDYRDFLQWLYALEARRGMDFKLERVEFALRECGNPHRVYPVLHVAGTNGKGSVAAMAEAVLRAHGLRTGLYTSPHLQRFTERIRVGGEEISPHEVLRLAGEVHRVSTLRGIELTFFEFTTVLAFLYFAQRRVDIAVIEVGLGGRLDATNVVDPAVSVITTIGLDHQEFLGDTLESIAAEKAGIVKPGRPVVVGHVEAGPARVIREIARQRGAQGLWLGRDFQWTGDDAAWAYVDNQGEIVVGELGLRGMHQCDNAAVTVAALRCLAAALRPSDGAIVRGLREVRWPGRLEIVRWGPTVILDGGHNPDGIRCLARELRRYVPRDKVHLLFGVMADKDWQAMLPALGPLCKTVTLTAPQVRRAMPPEALVSAWEKFAPVRVVQDPKVAMRRLLAECGEEETVLVTGSLFLVGAVRDLVTIEGDQRAIPQERVAD